MTPAEFAAEADASMLRRLVPSLDEPAAHAVAGLLGDDRVRTTLHDTWHTPPKGEPMLAETLATQLAHRPDLAQMILASPALAGSLTARPRTLHDLASHQQAIDVLGEVLDDIAQRGAAAVAGEAPATVRPTPLNDSQRRLSASFTHAGERAIQPGFDLECRDDPAYRANYRAEMFRF
ncbi:hypothetical protein ACH4OY_09745 [Micromonospora rubida]|uniref:DUF222 domain-containing protein n=1 Tax=Micromonospora rubida TaxID=2697657 RepID=A0ABW7SJ76_9ACTN